MNGNGYTKPLVIIAIAIVAVITALEFLGRYAYSNIFAKATWVDPTYKAVTKINVGDEKILTLTVPSWFKPSKIQWTSSLVGTLAEVDWPASTGNTYVQRGGPAGAAGQVTDYAVVSGTIFGFIPMRVSSNKATLTVA